LELRPIDRNKPVVDTALKPLQNLQIFCTQVRAAILDLYSGVGSSSGSFDLDDGSASADGVFMFDDGGA
jgi:hypothetical protein